MERAVTSPLMHLNSTNSIIRPRPPKKQLFSQRLHGFLKVEKPLTRRKRRAGKTQKTPQTPRSLSRTLFSQYKKRDSRFHDRLSLPITDNCLLITIYFSLLTFHFSLFPLTPPYSSSSHTSKPLCRSRSASRPCPSPRGYRAGFPSAPPGRSTHPRIAGSPSHHFL